MKVKTSGSLKGILFSFIVGCIAANTLTVILNS